MNGHGCSNVVRIQLGRQTAGLAEYYPSAVSCAYKQLSFVILPILSLALEISYTVPHVSLLFQKFLG